MQCNAIWSTSTWKLHSVKFEQGTVYNCMASMLWRPPLTHTGSLPSALIFYHFERKKDHICMEYRKDKLVIPCTMYANGAKPKSGPRLTHTVPLPSALLSFWWRRHVERNALRLPHNSLTIGTDFFFEDIHIWNDLHGNKKEKRVVNNFGFCKISSCPAISAQVAAKSFHEPATKICWYPLFSQTWLWSKNMETLGQNT